MDRSIQKPGSSKPGLPLACVIVVLSALMSACAGHAPATTDKPRQEVRTPKGTVLWVVRFHNEIEPQLPPTSLAVFVENHARTHGGQFSFKAHRNEPGRVSEFAVRLNLPPGTYRVTRMLGTAGDGSSASQFDFGTQMQFAVIDKETTYIGNHEITNRLRTDERQPATAPRAAPGTGDAARFSQGTPLVTANNGISDDLVTLHTLWPDLRKRRIATRLPPRLVVLGPDNTIGGGVEARAPAPGAPSGEYVTGSSLSVEAGQDLPPAVQKAFAKFKRAKQPRAFAVGPGDAFAAVSVGQDVVARSIAACNAKLPQRPMTQACRLYAIDDTVMSTVVARPPAPAPVPASSPRRAVPVEQPSLIAPTALANAASGSAR